MNKLDEVKDEVVKEHGYKSFEDFDDKSTWNYDHNTPKIIDEIAKRFSVVAINDILKALKIEMEMIKKDEI